MTIKNPSETTKKMITLYKEGFSTKEIGKLLKRSTENVRKTLIYHNVYKTKAEKDRELMLKEKSSKRKSKETRDAIMNAVLDGKELKAVAEEFGVDHHYVRQLVYREARERKIKISLDKDIVSLVNKADAEVEAPTQLSMDTVEVESAPEEVATENEASTEQTKEGLCTIMLDSMIKSDEGSKVLKSKGIFNVAREIENAVDGFLR